MTMHDIFWWIVGSVAILWILVILISAIFHYVTVHRLLGLIENEAETVKNRD